MTQELHQQYYEERTEIECKIKLNFYKNARIACIQKHLWHCIFLDGPFTGYSIQVITTMSLLNKQINQIIAENLMDFAFHGMVPCVLSHSETMHQMDSEIIWILVQYNL